MTVTSPSIYCRRCDYALDGLPDPRCPECGSAFDPADPTTFADHPGRRRSSAAIKLAAAAAVASALLFAGLILRPRLIAVGAAAWLTLWVVHWAVVFAFAAWAWRRLRPPTLPWLAAYWLVRLVAELVTPHLIQRIMARQAPPSGLSFGDVMSILSFAGGVAREGAQILAALLILSEVTHLIARDGPPTALPLRLLLSVRQHPTPFGIALVALAASYVVTIAALAAR